MHANDRCARKQMMISAEQRTLSTWKRRQRRVILAVACGTAASCLAIAGASSVFAGTHSNPYVSENNSAEKNANAIVLPPQSIQRKERPRPTRLPAVSQGKASASPNTESDKPRPQLLPPVNVESPSEPHATSQISDNKPGSKKPTESLNANDYVLPDLTDDSSTQDLRLEAASVQETELSSEIADNDVGPQVSLEPPVILQSPLAASNVSVDPRRPIRPVEVGKSGEPTFSVTSSAAMASDAISQLSSPQSEISPRLPAPHAPTKNVVTQPAVKNWLSSTTSTSSGQDARRLLNQAMTEYSRRAWASAEASAWESLRQSAMAIDIANREASFGSNRADSSAIARSSGGSHRDSRSTRLCRKIRTVGHGSCTSHRAFAHDRGVEESGTHQRPCQRRDRPLPERGTHTLGSLGEVSCRSCSSVGFTRRYPLGSQRPKATSESDCFMPPPCCVARTARKRITRRPVGDASGRSRTGSRSKMGA